MALTRIRDLISAACLVLFPLLILAYWALYPAYGVLDNGALIRAIDGHATRTAMADAFAFAGTVLSIPATLALMRVLASRAPRLALIGGSATLAGWIALIGVLMGDVVAVKMVEQGALTSAVVDLFTSIMNSPPMIALNVVALFHIVGGIVLGVALWRTRLVPRWAGVAAALCPPIHLGANLAGVLWLDALTWIALAAAYACVAAFLLYPERSPAAPVVSAPLVSA